MKKQALIGSGLILLAVIIFLNQFSIININIFFDGWWTLFIIIPVILGIITENNKTGPVIGLSVGLILLLTVQNIFQWKDVGILVIMMILLVVGISLIFPPKAAKNIDPRINKNESNTSVFLGSTTIDLIHEQMISDRVITCNVVMGEINLVVPDNCNVEVINTTIFGETKKYKSNNVEYNSTLYVKGICLLGEINIR